MASRTPTDDVDKVLDNLGVTNAPRTRENVKTSLAFFDRHMPMLPWATRLSFLKAMDLHSPVRVDRLGAGAKVVAWRPRGGPLHGTFYTIGGESPQRMSMPTTTRGRYHQAYTLRCSVQVLASRTAAFMNASLGSGGGKQYIIPRAQTVLKARGHE